MSSKNASHRSFLYLLIFCAQALAETPALPAWPDNESVEKPVRVELAFRIGSDKPNEDFFQALSFFGVFFEPAVGILKQISRLPM